MTLRVEVDRDRCVAAGQCHLAAPNRCFDQSDEDGAVVLLDPTPDESLRDAVREAEALCPASAIRVLEDRSGGIAP